jgi:c-di-GMP-binding flagellar brake protein YcgR
MKTRRRVCVNLRCACGFHNKLLLERRAQYRKPTRLPGIFFNGSEKGPFVVTDISLAGVGFEVNDDISFKEGEKILVEFNLDDMAKSFVRREVVVRSIRGRKIGAEFHEMDPAESLYKALKFYLC